MSEQALAIRTALNLKGGNPMSDVMSYRWKNDENSISAFSETSPEKSTTHGNPEA